MHSKKISQAIFWLILFFNFFAFSQNEIEQVSDSLKGKSYKYLYNKFIENASDTLIAKIYLQGYLDKATLNKHKIARSEALNFLSYYEPDDLKKLELLKKSIKESNSVDSIFSIKSYNSLGVYYKNRYDYEKALQYYLKVMQLAIRSNDYEYEIIALNNIAGIKKSIFKTKEALELYRKCYYLDTHKGEKNQIIDISLNLAESFLYSKQHDSSSYYYHKVINEISNTKEHLLTKALINEGVNLYYKNKNKDAGILLKRGISFINLNSKNDNKLYILANYYLGKISQSKDNDYTVQYFFKVDSLLTSSNIVIPEVKDTYMYLSRYYAENGNYKKQSFYLDKLLTINDVILKRNLAISEKINKEFDTPLLLGKRDKLIKSLQIKNENLITEKIVLSSILIGVSILFYIQYKKRVIYKDRFEKILLDMKNKSEPLKKENKDSITTNVEIDIQVVNMILKKLAVFEAKNGYLKNTITVTSLAKKLSTNTKYLSKVINIHKGKSFINYINDLRIDYILKELQINSTLQRYKIIGIAKEAGFNSADSFSTAFKKKTGISPSYYIKNIKNKKK